MADFRAVADFFGTQKNFGTYQDRFTANCQELQSAAGISHGGKAFPFLPLFARIQIPRQVLFYPAPGLLEHATRARVSRRQTRRNGSIGNDIFRIPRAGNRPAHRRIWRALPRASAIYPAGPQCRKVRQSTWRVPGSTFASQTAHPEDENSMR